MSSDRKEFKKELLKAMQGDPTEIIPKETTIIKDAPSLGTSTEDFLKARETISKKLPEVPMSLKYGKLPNLPKGEDFDPEGTASLHKTTNQVSPEAQKYVQRQQTKGKVFQKLAKLFGGKLGMAAKIAGPALGIASDALASEDIGSPEMERKQLEEAKREEIINRLPANQKAAYQEVMKKSKELAEKPVMASDLLEVTKPMIKEVGGEPDIRPEKAIKMLGEQESSDAPSIKEDLSRQNYEKMLKKRLGY
jgi:hypothetical protein